MIQKTLKIFTLFFFWIVLQSSSCYGLIVIENRTSKTVFVKTTLEHPKFDKKEFGFEEMPPFGFIDMPIAYSGKNLSESNATILVLNNDKNDTLVLEVFPEVNSIKDTFIIE